MKDVSVEEIFNLGEKYKMDMNEIVGLKRTVIVGLIAVDICQKLGLESEVEEAVKKEFGEF